MEAGGTQIPRPEPKDGSAPEKLDDRARRVAALMAALTAGVPAERTERNEEQQARWLLAHLLDWHRREAKAPWWEFFRLRDLSEEELLAEKAALSGLQFLERVGGTTKCPVDRYGYPRQEMEVRNDDLLHLPDGTDFGEVDRIDRVAHTVDIKKRGAQAEVHPSALFAHTIMRTDVLADALLRIAEDVVQNGIAGGMRYRAARELLPARPPRLRTTAFQAQPRESAVEFGVRIAPDLDYTVLAIQGPPGAGKTYTGARMICELVRRGARVGVTAVSHKVIRNLLDAATKEAAKQQIAMRCAHKVTTKSDADTSIEELTSNEKVLDQLQDGRANLVGATPWLWARPEAREAADVLFVDEAGQMSLANILAASQSAASVVLLGDPQQLEQPQQGTHPEGSDVSGLEHILRGRKTIPKNSGIFLPETWRLSPSICAFTSEVFYESKLHARAGLEMQVLVGTTPFEGAGLWVVPAGHQGNQNSSLEEVELIDKIIARLLHPEARWIDGNGRTHSVTPDDVLIIAPYNSQVSLLTERLGNGRARVGTVDKFQGQEAPIAIYSMATSRPEDAPRGMEFLYSLNRLNVATSRARCASILVASPRLFEPECKSPRQMQLANALCRYVELARPVALT
jgi:AAA domain